MMNVGIIGAGHIARKMANTINALEGFNAYAVASRSLEKAEAFKTDFNFDVAYGSYEELAKDKNVDLIYIATPHSEHYANMLLCLKYNKPVICEKIFTTSSKDTKEIYRLFEEKGVFVLEAMWCAFMPLRKITNNLLSSGVIGKVTKMEASFEYSLMHKERVRERSLGGGAVMDIGLYPISFALRTFGFNPDKVEIKDLRKENGVDVYEKVVLTYGDVEAICVGDALTTGPSDIKIYGDKGYIYIDRVTAAKSVKVYDLNNNLIQEINCECPLGGFEYELIACKKAIENKQIETIEWSHSNSILLSEIIDKIVY